MTISDQFIFCPPLLGKPNPNQNKPLYGPDTRDRVLQQGTKGFTCWCVAYDMLRERYRAPNTTNLAGRQFEKIASQVRKRIVIENQTLPKVMHCMNQFKLALKQVTQNPTKKQCQSIMEWESSIQSGTLFQSILPAFKAQRECNNLYDYITSLKYAKRFEALGELFKQLNIDPVAVRRALRPYDMPVKNHLLNHKMRALIAKGYHLEISSWEPDQSIESLIEELKKHGPLIVHGSFGKPSHKVAATDVGEEIEGRKIFAWKWGRDQMELSAVAHMVILVGAKKSDRREFVYYIDPLDDSDPADPAKQTVYKMHYGELIDEDSILTLDGSKGEMIVRKPGYALYFDRAAAQKQLAEELDDAVETIRGMTATAKKMGLIAILA